MDGNLSGENIQENNKIDKTEIELAKPKVFEDYGP